MKFLRKLLLPLLSILLVAGNQTLENLYSYPLGVSSSVKHTTKADVNARDCAKQGDKALQPKNTISAAKKGLQREHKVAKITGGRIMKNAKGQDVEINVKGVGKTGLDVVGKNGEYITVGGPAKAKNIDGLKSRLHVLRKAAERDGVKAQAYFSKDTPKEAIEAAKKMLGNDNVFIFNE